MKPQIDTPIMLSCLPQDTLIVRTNQTSRLVGQLVFDTPWTSPQTVYEVIGLVGWTVDM